MIRFWVMGAVVAACTLTLPGKDHERPAGEAAPIAGDAISVTALDDIAGEAAVKTAVLPEAEPEAEPEAKAVPEVEPEAELVPEAAAEPEVVLPPQSPEELACRKGLGAWVTAGKSGAKTCAKPTRDGGKRCVRQSQCEGLCLARSGTCAPVIPLFGCNEIFQDDGSLVTLCID